MADKTRFYYLYEQYLKKRLTPEELLEWKEVLADSSLDPDLKLLADQLWDRDDIPVPAYNKVRARKIYNEIVRGTRKISLWPRIVAAAAILLICSAGLLYLTDGYQRFVKASNPAVAIDPGVVGATLTLSNGESINLSKVDAGEIARESDVIVTKSENGQIVYEAPVSSKDTVAHALNVLSTANGQTYMLTLPDKSRVWLNAASSITYAASLTIDGIRKVTLVGEAYFEVAKDKRHPFVVESKGQEVTVLGTHFNVSAYADDAAVRTTLIEGAVQVSTLPSSMGSEQFVPASRLLQPGQQSLLLDNQLQIRKVETDDAVAWKNGYFMFNRETLGSIMSKLARWYNIQVVFKDNELRKKTLFGTVSRFDDFSKVLEVLERTKAATFTVEGNTVIITK